MPLYRITHTCISIILMVYAKAEISNVKYISRADNIQESSVNAVDGLPSYFNATMYADLNTQFSPANQTFTKSPEHNGPKNISCLPSVGESKVTIVNDTELMKLLVTNLNVTNKETPASCLLIMFYSKYCPFSCLAAPHFNALPRAFPGIKMVAVDAKYHVFNVQNGVVGVPTLMLFHNSKPVAKYNDSEYTLELFSQFLTKYTGIAAAPKSIVTSADFTGPVSSVPLMESNFELFLAWFFICVCMAYYFSKTKYWLWIVEGVQNIWRESEAQAQHEHTD